MNILNITESPLTDESIESYEVHEYEPITGTSLNNNGEIRIVIESQDIFTHPGNSYLIVEGTLNKRDSGDSYSDNDVITLTNNAIMHLFTNIRYNLSSQEI